MVSPSSWQAFGWMYISIKGRLSRCTVAATPWNVRQGNWEPALLAVAGEHVITAKLGIEKTRKASVKRAVVSMCFWAAPTHIY